MTEAEWLAAKTPDPMLAHLRGAATDRKLRLLMVACARSVLPAAADDAMVRALEVAEQFADGSAPRSVLARARKALADDHSARVGDWFPLYTEHIRSVPAWHATRDAMTQVHNGMACCAWSSTRRGWPGGGTYMTYPDDEYRTQVGLIRCLFSNPFRPVAAEPGWRTSAVVDLAAGIYEDRAWDRLPVLADALEDAGCANADVLGHLRGPGPHARGCWVVDLILGKT